MNRADPAAVPRTRVLFVEQFYWPEGWGGAALPRDVTLHLQEAGFAVEVVCGSDQYVAVDGDPGPDPAASGIHVRRLRRLFGGDIHSRKLLRQLWFYVALLPVLFVKRPPDVYAAQTNPPLAVVLVALAARLFGRPFVIVAQDLYPETLFVHGTVRGDGLIGRLLRRAFAIAYRSATDVVALGPMMRERLLAKGVAASRIVEISNWSTGPAEVVRGPANRLRGEWDTAGRFVLLYSGNLGVGHEFDTLLDGIARARAEVLNLLVLFVGRGSRLEEVRAGVAARRLDDVVRFHGFLPAERLPESLGLADLGVVTMRDGFEGLIVPSKLLGQMARGLPTLYVGPPSDVSSMVDETDCGYVVRSGDVDGVRRAIVDAAANAAALSRLGENGRRAYEASYSRPHGLARYAAVFAAAAVQARR